MDKEFHDQEIARRLERIERMLDQALGEREKPMNIPAAAERLNVSEGWLRDLCKKGMIPAGSKSERATHRQYLVKCSDVEMFIRSGGCDRAIAAKFEKKSKHQTKTTS